MHSSNMRSVSAPSSQLLISDEHEVPLDEPTGVLNSAYPGRNSTGGQRRGKGVQDLDDASSHCDSNAAHDVNSEGDPPRTFSVKEGVINIHNLRGVVAISKYNE